jgi:putative PIN family toxin of toxin-antitoxin system
VCLALAEAGQITLLVSRTTLTEARDVLNRPEILELKPDLTPDQVSQFLEALAYRSEFLSDVPRGPGYARDPEDQSYLDLAVAGGADYLVTRDKDLLSLTESYTVEAKQFRQRHQNHLRILAPTIFLQRSEQQDDPG